MEETCGKADVAATPTQILFSLLPFSLFLRPVSCPRRARRGNCGTRQAESGTSPAAATQNNCFFFFSLSPFFPSFFFLFRRWSTARPRCQATSTAAKDDECGLGLQIPIFFLFSLVFFCWYQPFPVPTSSESVSLI